MPNAKTQALLGKMQKQFGDNAIMWAAVPGWPYEVSTVGAVRRSDTGRPSRVYREPVRGYWCVRMWREGKERGVPVHIIMLEAFVGPRPPGQFGRHLDDNRDNNTLENLAWGTKSENQLDQVRNGRHANANKDTCRYGHRLEWPNLLPAKAARGQRNCKACNRAMRFLRVDDPGFAELADAKYVRIMP